MGEGMSEMQPKKNEWLVIKDASNYLYFSPILTKLSSLKRQAKAMDAKFPQVAPHKVVLVREVEEIPEFYKNEPAK
jgi:hypothetical protein